MKEAAVLARSFKDAPPTYTLVFRLLHDHVHDDLLAALQANPPKKDADWLRFEMDDLDGFDADDADYVRLPAWSFIRRQVGQKFRDLRKKYSTEVEYEWRDEFNRFGNPHAHITVRSSLSSDDILAELRKRLRKVLGRVRFALYCDDVHNVEGLARYLAKNVKDRRRVFRPPHGWRGRLVACSRRFLIKRKEALWREQVAEWYPARQHASATPSAPAPSARDVSLEADSTFDVASRNQRSLDRTAPHLSQAPVWWLFHPAPNSRLRDRRLPTRKVRAPPPVAAVVESISRFMATELSPHARQWPTLSARATRTPQVEGQVILSAGPGQLPVQVAAQFQKMHCPISHANPCGGTPGASRGAYWTWAGLFNPCREAPASRLRMSRSAQKKEEASTRAPSGSSCGRYQAGRVPQRPVKSLVSRMSARISPSFRGEGARGS